MERLIERYCGLDVHKATVSACVRVTQRPGGEVKQEVRTFATTTPELLSSWPSINCARPSRTDMPIPDMGTA
jgi:hypothetical protein